jgi:hypothetical protein
MAFSWLCPGAARDVPRWVWERLRLPQPTAGIAPEVDARRVRLMDSRPWFVPELSQQ